MWSRRLKRKDNLKMNNPPSGWYVEVGGRGMIADLEKRQIWFSQPSCCEITTYNYSQECASVIERRNLRYVYEEASDTREFSRQKCSACTTRVKSRSRVCPQWQGLKTCTLLCQYNWSFKTYALQRDDNVSKDINRQKTFSDIWSCVCFLHGP